MPVFALMREHFIRQMATYSAYHRDPRNRMTHFIGVPIIIFSILLLVAPIRVGEVYGLSISWACILLFLVSLYWILMNPLLGLMTALLYFPVLVFARHVSVYCSEFHLPLFLLTFLGGWTMQGIGHVFEGRRPAFFGNVLQLFIAPVFLVTEVVVATGWLRGLKEEIESRQGEFT